MSLHISEIFHSIQGESSFAGWPCTFLRLAGCGHCCRYCDTAYAEEEGISMELDEVLQKVSEIASPVVEITGGEPLLQKEVYPLMKKLCDRGETVLLETGGFISVADVDPRVHCIIDLKAPSSGVSDGNHPENISLALSSDPGTKKHIEFKIVVADRNDYLWAKKLLDETGLHETSTIMMGVVFGKLEPADLAGWVLGDSLRVRMQLQLHKYIWDPGTRGV
ncbi:MAG: radical SAM protein [Chlorobiaceae bacterium]|jgi:7-carboxy-7-deazaguanine synthase|nr:radical SAM protein [Chlorobiaceae bacterium]